MTTHKHELHGDGPEWGSILDGTPLLISIHDADHRIIKANAALKALLRTVRTGIIGRKCCEVMHGTRRPPAYCPHSRALRTGSHQRKEFFEPRLGMRIAVSCHPILGAGGQVVVSIHLAAETIARPSSNTVLTKNLTDRQKEILKLLCGGQRTKTIAAQLGISPRTVEYHKQRMMRMFSAHSLAELIAHVLTKNPSLVG